LPTPFAPGRMRRFQLCENKSENEVRALRCNSCCREGKKGRRLLNSQQQRELSASEFFLAGEEWLTHVWSCDLVNGQFLDSMAPFPRLAVRMHACPDEKRPNRGFGSAGTETTRGTTDIAAYRSGFGFRLPIPSSGKARPGIVGNQGCYRHYRP
jgi:hypothetical protein